MACTAIAYGKMRVSCIRRRQAHWARLGALLVCAVRLADASCSTHKDCGKTKLWCDDTGTCLNCSAWTGDDLSSSITRAAPRTCLQPPSPPPKKYSLSSHPPLMRPLASSPRPPPPPPRPRPSSPSRRSPSPPRVWKPLPVPCPPPPPPKKKKNLGLHPPLSLRRPPSPPPLPSPPLLEHEVEAENGVSQEPLYHDPFEIDVHYSFFVIAIPPSPPMTTPSPGSYLSVTPFPKRRPTSQTETHPAAPALASSDESCPPGVSSQCQGWCAPKVHTNASNCRGCGKCTACEFCAHVFPPRANSVSSTKTIGSLQRGRNPQTANASWLAAQTTGTVPKGKTSNAVNKSRAVAAGTLQKSKPSTSAKDPVRASQPEALLRAEVFEAFRLAHEIILHHVYARTLMLASISITCAVLVCCIAACCSVRRRLQTQGYHSMRGEQVDLFSEDDDEPEGGCTPANRGHAGMVNLSGRREVRGRDGLQDAYRQHTSDKEARIILSL